jgi:hypothetical protein
MTYQYIIACAGSELVKLRAHYEKRFAESPALLKPIHPSQEIQRRSFSGSSMKKYQIALKKFYQREGEREEIQRALSKIDREVATYTPMLREMRVQHTIRFWSPYDIRNGIRGTPESFSAVKGFLVIPAWFKEKFDKTQKLLTRTGYELFHASEYEVCATCHVLYASMPDAYQHDIWEPFGSDELCNACRYGADRKCVGCSNAIGAEWPLIHYCRECHRLIDLELLFVRNNVRHSHKFLNDLASSARRLDRYRLTRLQFTLKHAHSILEQRTWKTIQQLHPQP